MGPDVEGRARMVNWPGANLSSHSFTTLLGVSMTKKKGFTAKQAKEIGDKLGITWTEYDVEQLRMGIDVELSMGPGASPPTSRTTIPH